MRNALIALALLATPAQAVEETKYICNGEQTSTLAKARGHTTYYLIVDRFSITMYDTNSNDGLVMPLVEPPTPNHVFSKLCTARSCMGTLLHKSGLVSIIFTSEHEGTGEFDGACVKQR